MLTSHPLPVDVGDRWRRIADHISAQRLAVDRAGAPRFSRRGIVWNATWASLQSLIVALAWLANVVPLAGSWLAGKILADGPNTIALWRILIGTPLSLLWWFSIIAGAVVAHRAWIVPTYLAMTALGLIAYPEWCVRRAMLRNARASRELRDDVAALAEWSRHVAA
jgi:hypothetical protein